MIVIIYIFLFNYFIFFVIDLYTMFFHYHLLLLLRYSFTISESLKLLLVILCYLDVICISINFFFKIWVLCSQVLRSFHVLLLLCMMDLTYLLLLLVLILQGRHSLDVGIADTAVIILERLWNICRGWITSHLIWVFILFCISQTLLIQKRLLLKLKLISTLLVDKMVWINGVVVVVVVAAAAAVRCLALLVLHWRTRRIGR